MLGRLYIAYLLVAPAGATAMATVTYAGPADFVLALLWFGGMAAVAVYAAFVGTYLRPPAMSRRTLLAIVDGPLWVVMAAVTLQGWRVLDLLTWFFVSESIAIYLASAALSVRKAGDLALPSMGIMIVCIAVVSFACGWGLWPMVFADSKSALLFVASVVQSAVAAYWVADRNESVRDTDKSAAMILSSIGLCQVGIGLGALLRFAVLR